MPNKKNPGHNIKKECIGKITSTISNLVRTNKELVIPNKIEVDTLKSLFKNAIEQYIKNNVTDKAVSMYQKKHAALSTENINKPIYLMNWSLNKKSNLLKDLKENKKHINKKIESIGTIRLKFWVNKKGTDDMINHKGWKPVEGYIPFHEKKFPFANSLA